MVRFFAPALIAALCTLAPLSMARAQGNAPAQKGAWSATGTLLEACTCAPPCSCNFGEGPSPHPYCHAVFAYKLEKAVYNGVDLSGLVVAAADGPNGESAFTDSRATPAQRPALEKLGKLIFAQGGAANTATRFTPAVITHEVKGNRLRLAIGQNGGWDADLILGRDGKTPIVVENNLIWPIARAVKGRTRTLNYKDTTAGAISGERTNANYGAFAFGGPLSGAVATATKKAAAPLRFASVKQPAVHPAHDSEKDCCKAKTK